MNIGKLTKILEYLSVNGYDEEAVALGYDTMFLAGPDEDSAHGTFLKTLGAFWSEDYECWEVLF